MRTVARTALALGLAGLATTLCLLAPDASAGEPATVALDRVQGFELWARRVTAAVFIGVGVYETLRSTLHLIG